MFGVTHRDPHDEIPPFTSVSLGESNETSHPLFIVFPGVGIYVRLSATVVVSFKGHLDRYLLHTNSMSRLLPSQEFTLI